jgi:hypothetical protein
MAAQVACDMMPYVGMFMDLKKEMGFGIEVFE